MFNKALVGATIALVGSGIMGAAPADADPNLSGTQPNPFSTLSCSRQGCASPTGSRDADIFSGVWDGLHS